MKRIKVTFKDLKTDRVSLSRLGLFPFVKVYHVWYDNDGLGIYNVLPAAFLSYEECKKYKRALIKEYPNIKFIINSSLCFSK